MVLFYCCKTIKKFFSWWLYWDVVLATSTHSANVFCRRVYQI